MGPKNRRAYILVIPSLFTTGNLFCGFYSIIHSFAGEFQAAAYAIFLAGIFDVLDGRIARITHSTSKFGVEYDSIADVVSFGVAPAVLSYVWVLQPFGRLGWASAFFFAACGALRLARFNTIAEELPKAYFLGLPIPAAAYSIAASYIAFLKVDFEYANYVLLILSPVLGFLMVSSIRYRSFKELDWRRKQSFVLLVVIVIAIAAIATQPELGIGLLFAYYVLGGALREVYLFIRNPSDRQKKYIAPRFVTTDQSQEDSNGGE
ncbi:MAG: CDP-diacylglycerol--serine O-phosphatidyltransferase [Deltaproteobacteria bacterium]|nr:CDP-diacylglycerol--serine O-phosphatidyltransferase [Deltaproteobacteria bacterium]